MHLQEDAAWLKITQITVLPPWLGGGAWGLRGREPGGNVAAAAAARTGFPERRWEKTSVDRWEGVQNVEGSRPFLTQFSTGLLSEDSAVGAELGVKARLDPWPCTMKGASLAGW